MIFDQVFLDNSYPVDYGFQPDVILDCGANVGFATVFFKNQFPNAKIVCVEPDSGNYEMLCKNTQNFKDVILYKAGLWNKSAHLIIENPDADAPSFVVKEVEAASPESIKAVTIKEIMEEQQIDFIDILKIDIEGSEKEVFSSNYDYWLPRTRVIIIEMHDRMKDGCSKSFFEALVKYDFKIELSGENIICFINPSSIL
ncbi:hypothetical protein AGMMS49982_18870 [Bacteroidia bacterium]|nr:hypothetical protein AGMMS49982_18870 [Bacteroidia bacterium]